MKSLQQERFCGGPEIYIDDPLKCLSILQYQSIYQQLEVLAEQCPSNSLIQLNVSLNEYAQITAQLSVNSLKLQFSENCKASHVLEAWDVLKSKAQKKIQHWKSQRFRIPFPKAFQDQPPLAS